MLKVNIMILNYNGRELLQECLPSILKAKEASKNLCKVTIIDNLSTDNSVEYIRKEFPDVCLVKAKENRFLCSYNDVIKEVDDDIVILLNNDIKVDEGFIDSLIEIFVKHQDAFMAVPRSYLFDGSFEAGRAKMKLRWGIFWTNSRYQGYEKDIDRPGFSMQSGFGAFDRGKFLFLGGYDDLFLPGRLEDSDLCFRAWKRGWKGYYVPESIVYHKGGASFIKRFGQKGTLIINHRNSFLFVWKNITDPSLLVQHYFFLLPRLVFALIRGKLEIVVGFFKALKLLPEAIKRKKQMQKEVALSDREVFSILQ